MAGQRTLPGLGLTGFWDLGSNGWKNENDANLRLLSALCQASVKSRTTSLPTGSNGDIYIVPAADTNGNEIAIKDNGAWVYVTAKAGFLVYVEDAAEYATFDGSAWQTLTTGGGGATYPDFTGNAGKVLAVNTAEDGVEWVTDQTGGGGGGGSTDPESAHSYWRLTIAGAHVIEAWIRDLEFRETIGGDDLTSATDTSPAIATVNASAASSAFDSSSSYWASGQSFPASVGWHFASPVKVGEIAVDFGDANRVFSGFRVEFSDDGETWSLAWDWTGTVAGQTGNVFTAPWAKNIPDMPEIVAGDAGKVLAVNATEDGAEWIDAPSGGGANSVSVSVFAGGAMQASEVIVYHLAVASTTFAIDMAGSFAKCLVAPTADAVFSIQHNGTQVGTLTFSASSTTGTFAMAAALTLAAGDDLRLVAPATADTTLEGVSVSMKGSI